MGRVSRAEPCLWRGALSRPYPWSEMRRQLIGRDLHEIFLDSAGQPPGGGPVESLADGLQRARRCDEQQVVEGIFCSRLVQVVRKRACKFIFLERVQIMPRRQRMMSR